MWMMLAALPSGLLIGVTTYVSTDSKIEGLESGADGYLTQPFEPQDLVATVRSLARLRSAEADLQARNRALLLRCVPTCTIRSLFSTASSAASAR